MIILIEDNTNDAELTKLALKKANIDAEIKWLRDGADAVEFFQEQMASDLGFIKNVRMVFLDLKMPKVSGFEVLSTLRGMSELTCTPLIVLSSSSVESDIQKAYKLGANSYIVKPINYKQHAKVISDAAGYWTTINKTLY